MPAEQFNTFIVSAPVAATPLAGNELVPVIQGGVTKQVAASVLAGIKTYFNSSPGLNATTTDSGIVPPVKTAYRCTLTVNVTNVTTPGNFTMFVQGTIGAHAYQPYGPVVAADASTTTVIDDSNAVPIAAAADTIYTLQAIVVATDASNLFAACNFDMTLAMDYDMTFTIEQLGVV